MSLEERQRVLGNIVRLRRAERQTPSRDVALVREDLEAELDGTVSRSLAASLLGVSHTALNNWIGSGDVPVVISARGRQEVPLPTLLDLHERVSEQRASGGRKLHALEPIMAAAKARAERLNPAAVLADVPDRSDPHRTPELRGLAYHRVLAPRLRRPMVEEAERKLSRWQRDGKIDARHAEAWQEVFAMPMSQIRTAISADDQLGRDLRQNSPLAGLLSEPERRKILAKV